MEQSEIIQKTVEFLQEDKEHVYRSLGAIAEHIGLSKSEVLKALLNAPELVMVFNEKTYSPASGPYFGTKEELQAKKKEIKDQLESEKKAEKQKKEKQQEKKEESRSEEFSKPKKPSLEARRKKLKFATRKMIALHMQMDDLFDRYAYTMVRSDQKIFDQARKTIDDFSALIQLAIDHGNFDKKDLGIEKKNEE